MIIEDRDSVSFRSIREEVDCSIIAKLFGGKGHKNAASSPKEDLMLKEYIKKAK